MDDKTRVIQRIRSTQLDNSETNLTDPKVNDPTVNEIKDAMIAVETEYKMSEIIRDRILKYNEAVIEDEEEVTFRCNDNISAFIKDEEELDWLVDEVTKNMEAVLRSLVIDVDNDHNTRDTARRVAKMMVKETFSGRFIPEPTVTAFPNMGYAGLYTTGPISIRSTCAHHFQNIVGKCWVGVVPDKEVIGLSKFNRIVHHIAERPQIQEELTTQVAKALKRFTKSENIAVVIKAEHHCMTHRGVKEHESDMVTTLLSGSFEDNDALRAEFYSIIQNLRSF